MRAILSTPPPDPPGARLASRIKLETRWAHPTPTFAGVDPGGVVVMTDDQWKTYKRMLARRARENRARSKTGRGRKG